MSNNIVINHDTYAEITNGLFFVNAVIFGVSTDDPEEFTFRQKGIQIIPKETTEVSNQIITMQDLEEVVDIVFRSRVNTESRPDRFHNMSEQEILNYLDQISQEE